MRRRLIRCVRDSRYACPTMRQKLHCAFLPRSGQRERAAGLPGNRQGLETGGLQNLLAHTDGIVADYVLWSRHRVRGNRNTARQCLELNHTERVGAAWKHEYV